MVQEQGAIEAAQLSVIANYPRVNRAKRMAGQLGGPAKAIADYLLKSPAKKASRPKRGARIIRRSDAF